MRGFLAEWCTAHKGKGQALEVIIAGHGLGGVLTPVFALWLAEKNWLHEDATCSDAELLAYSFAAPTPGNADFASCVDERLKKVGPGLKRIHNPYDVAPYVWAAKDIKVIPYL